MKPTLIAAVSLLALVAVVQPVVMPDIAMNVLTDNVQLSEFSSQARQERQRPRIRVQREQPAAWDYPRPGDFSWPGPGAVRQCVDWYATEYRPSGTVITPQMRCRWVRG